MRCLLHFLVLNVEIELGAGEGGMAEQFLYGGQIDTFTQQQGGVGMAQVMASAAVVPLLYIKMYN